MNGQTASTAFAGLILAVSVAGQDVTITVPSSLPTTALQRNVDNAFPGFGIETVSFPDFSGSKASPNIFNENLVQNLADKVGTGIIFRVGGNTGDYSTYDPTQPQPVTIQSKEHGNTPLHCIIGKSYMDGFANFPSSTKWVWQHSMAHPNEEAGAIQETKDALAAIGDNLLSIEIGNEPDLYVFQGARANGYNVQDYVTQWLKFADDLAGNTTIPRGSIFQTCDFFSGTSWKVRDVFQDGLNNAITTSGYIQSVSQHHYPTVDTDPTVTLGGSLMNHFNIRKSLEKFMPSIQYLQQNHPNIPFVLGEVGSSLNPNGNNNYALGAVLGSALWTIDYMLYAMTIGVARINMQLGTGFGYGAWQPVHFDGGKPPSVKAPYYGIAMIADFIGKSKNVKVANLDLNDEHTSAYAAYDSGKLSKIAIVNLNQWKSTQTTPRPSKNFNLTLPVGISSVRVYKLTGPGAERNDGITWADVSYTYANMGVGEPSGSNTKTLTVNGGKVTVNVQDSEAAMVTMIS